MSTDDENIRREFESLKEILGEKVKSMEANNRADLAENKSATDQLRTDIEKSVNSITLRMIGIVGLGVAILALILKQ